MIVNFTSCVFVFLENVATDYYLLNQQVEGEREMEGEVKREREGGEGREREREGGRADG